MVKEKRYPINFKDFEQYLKGLGNSIKNLRTNDAFIMLHGYIESVLEELISNRLVSSSKDLPIPKYSFHHKVELAHRIGLITKEFRNNLHTTGDIRNAYSHWIFEKKSDKIEIKIQMEKIDDLINKFLQRAESHLLLKKYQHIRKDYYISLPQGDVLIIMAAMLYELLFRKKIVKLSESLKERVIMGSPMKKLFPVDYIQ
ncbi:MAG: hypothetical protein WBB67_02685 [bacterium]